MANTILERYARKDEKSYAWGSLVISCNFMTAQITKKQHYVPNLF